ncbi:type VI secretion system tube protein Hcp [Cereibacter sphaeroides]|uniref:Hcp family type VI secretion system effector n=1 Tax=Rhodobacterales TaxID=204455 RepID=UPI000BBEE280|nr:MULTISPECIES: type VI secretion system tube protein Hcp [Paracoccaceae]MCE6950764.1 type VI secretion system tube protein Hcp [Cereibacter sphaeroides]MCE6959784.1 type VI secretion system tube protein Hcp [Cereibacter sphaeroides]MCE6968748.1 type VI secretion system tube protein Hcp [Cereibacter sphaeroides]MCE6974638.1 type VI secretion system tube protein Hcp [Cereibacter sphaeroides]
MAFTGYLKIEDIKGESKRADHEEEIDLFGASWSVEQASSAATGSGRSRGRAKVNDFHARKWMDAASPYLALACMQGKSFPEMVFMARKDSGEAHLDYLQVTMKNCMISSYSMAQNAPEEAGSDMIAEEIGISFESLTFKYVVQAEDHSAGDEHEVEYDVVAAR